MNKTVLVTLYNNLLTFRDTDKKFKLQGGVLKMMINKNYNVDPAQLSGKKLMLASAKEMYFDEIAPANKSTRDGSLTRLLKSPSIIACASGVSSFHKKNISQKQKVYHMFLMNFVIRLNSCYKKNKLVIYLT